MYNAVFTYSLATLFFFLCLILFTLSFLKFNNTEYQFISSLGKNWNYGPVSNITISENECSDSKLSIINDFWTGTQHTCHCSNNRKYFTKCKKEENFLNFCKDVEEKIPIQYKFWKKTNICGKRLDNYLDLKTANSERECKLKYKNHKSCGIIDTLRNHLCFPVESECPYNFIKIIPKNSNFNERILNKTFIELDLYDNHTKLILSNEFIDKGRIITELKIDDDQTCTNSEYKYIKMKQYLHEKKSMSVKCKEKKLFFESSFEILDADNLKNLYTNNNMTKRVYSKPNLSQTYNLTSKTNLYYKNNVGLHNSCKERLLSKSSSDKVIYDLMNIENFMMNKKKLSIFGIVFCSFGLFTMLFFNCGTFFEGLTKKEITISTILQSIFLSAPIFILSLFQFYYLDNLNINLEIFSDPLCVDFNIIEGIQSFSKNIYEGNKFNFYNLIFSVSAFSLNFITYFLLCRRSL